MKELPSKRSICTRATLTNANVRVIPRIKRQWHRASEGSTTRMSYLGSYLFCGGVYVTLVPDDQRSSSGKGIIPLGGSRTSQLYRTCSTWDDTI